MRRSAVLALALLLPLAACQEEEEPLARAHAFWADSVYDQALAEYRLALARSGGRPEIRAYVAHAYAVTGDVRLAREHYLRVIQDAPRYRDQAVFDFVGAARRAHARRDMHGMAQAVEAAAELRPGSWPEELAAPLARYYARSGEQERALAFYEMALVNAPPDSARELLFELGTLREDQGDCRGALGYFDAYRARWPDGPRAGEARWQAGNCAFRLAQEAHQTGSLTTALEYFDMVTRLGAPPNLQDQAWFQRGEILFALGRDDDALAAYRRVLELSPLGTSQLSERAQRRMDQIRFGGQPEDAVL
ncbi:MAG TPA: tetratricopeptide repeat protein [Longimicrobiales bacterium]|nr:tetratricopeptide repeat protein [Longimicrobiales bacterium]